MDVESNASRSGATVVITHRVRPDRHADYEVWLREIGALCRAAPGHLDWQIVRPLPGLSTAYTVVIRFDTIDNLQRWMQSPTRSRLIEQAAPLLLDGDDFFIRSGLDFWFTPEGAKAKLPVRWKQYLLTWSAIYPLAVVVPLAVVPALAGIGATQPLVTTLAVTGVVVFLMVYVVMPRYTKLVSRWLFS